MRLFVFAFIIAAANVAGAAEGSAASLSRVMGGATIMCMNNLGQRLPISEYILGRKSERIPTDVAQAFLKSDSGFAYIARYDEGRELVVGLQDSGGCTLSSPDASPREVETMLIDEFRSNVHARLLGTESHGDLQRATYAVTFRGKQMFIRIVGREADQGAFVEVIPGDQPPASLGPQAKIDWPK
ncbi:MAG TPA: hypothetical protein VHN11_18495 [Xanthobacteraceae bacterium]|jgi:hypothetical protein|nr:hypothetical protein [Xanthobacteraceae bacterium]